MTRHLERPDSLDVFYGVELVGHIYNKSPLQFEYAQSWLSRGDPFALGIIPLRAGLHNALEIDAFFENLLPEGDLRLYLAEQRKASTLFALLYEIAGDNAGGFVILPTGIKPEPPQYQLSSWAALAKRLGKQSPAAIDIKGDGSRISLAGAQDKASIAIFDDGIPHIPQGTTPSTHILKPNIKRLDKVWHSAVNETIIMLSAKHCGLPTAEVFFEPITHSCIVRRFDRVIQNDGTLGRLIQYDLCQLAGTVSDKKYEKEGGPSVIKCAELIRDYSNSPAVDLHHFLEWVFFNIYIGNNDSHAKNLSLYWLPKLGSRLTPFYDLLCTRLYPGLSQEFAFSIGGETLPGKIKQENIKQFALDLGLKPSFVMGIANTLAAKIPEAIMLATQEVFPSLNPSEKTLTEKLINFVLSNTKKTIKRLND